MTCHTKLSHYLWSEMKRILSPYDFFTLCLHITPYSREGCLAQKIIDWS